jgi:hypothetical protein
MKKNKSILKMPINYKSPKGFIKNCIITRDSQDKNEMLFSFDNDTLQCYLDGYAIIPKKEYFKYKYGIDNYKLFVKACKYMKTGTLTGAEKGLHKSFLYARFELNDAIKQFKKAILNTKAFKFIKKILGINKKIKNEETI